MASLTIDLIIDQSEERSAVPVVAVALVQQVYTGLSGLFAPDKHLRLMLCRAAWLCSH